MRKLNEILAVILLSLAAVLVAAIGLRAYDAFVINRQVRQERWEQEQVLARNREANDRVREMRQEIQELSEDRERLVQFLEEIQTMQTEATAIPVSMMFDTQESGMSGNLPDLDMTSLSENAADMSENAVEEAETVGNEAENTTSLSGNMTSMTDNVTGMSQNSTLSENRFSVSGNHSQSENGLDISGDNSVSGNALSVSGNGLRIAGNDGISGNELRISENNTASGNALSVSGNDSISESTLGISENMLGVLSRMVSPKISLDERRKIRSSYEETMLVNEEDRICLAGRRTDFSGKKIACLGDSITAAANLEEEEGYLTYAYPSVLKEVLGAEEVYNLGIGGSAIGRYWSDAFVERYTQIPQDTDIIIVMGGTNDGFCLSEKEFGSLAERKPWTFCKRTEFFLRVRENRLFYCCWTALRIHTILVPLSARQIWRALTEL